MEADKLIIGIQRPSRIVPGNKRLSCDIPEGLRQCYRARLLRESRLDSSRLVAG